MAKNGFLVARKGCPTAPHGFLASLAPELDFLPPEIDFWWQEIDSPAPGNVFPRAGMDFPPQEMGFRPPATDLWRQMNGNYIMFNKSPKLNETLLTYNRYSFCGLSVQNHHWRLCWSEGYAQTGYCPQPGGIGSWKLPGNSPTYATLLTTSPQKLVLGGDQILVVEILLFRRHLSALPPGSQVQSRNLSRFASEIWSSPHPKHSGKFKS